MNLIDQVLAEPEFEATPPVLVDVGAAGGVPPGWRRLARRSVAVAFEPDAREAEPLTSGRQRFRRWIYIPAIVVAEPPPDGKTTLHLARSPQCSSTLPPQTGPLRRWAFAGLFEVVGRRDFPATTLAEVLRVHGLGAPDWIKCDTQGTDLRIFRSLPTGLRHRVLLTEFEPGLIDAYVGEDTLSQVLDAMRDEPFWLAECSLERTPLAFAGWNDSKWYRRLAPSAPGWGNLCYLRDVDAQPEELDRRALLLLWVLATLHGQPAYAHVVAAAGARRFGGDLFGRMQRASHRQLWWALVRRFPGWCVQRLWRCWR